MLRCARNDAERNNIAFKGWDVVRQYALKFFKTAYSGASKAVLTVGGIAGYSQTMTKYKVNRTIDEYMHLFRGLIEYEDSLKKLP